MFENILSFWKGREFMTQALKEFKEMLEGSETMFGLVCQRLIHNQNAEDLREKVYSIDQKINAREKNIRKNIVEHLILQPTVDVSACLVLMSVVKDAERLGDYCKNLYEVTDLLEKPLDQEKYKKMFNGIDEELAQVFKDTKTAFIESNESVAALSWEHKAKISKRCDEVIEQLAKSNISTNEAVCFTLIARHYKRLSSHLVNIATSVILPVSKLDYYDEPKSKS